MDFETYIEECLDLIKIGIDAYITVVDGEVTYMRPVEAEDCYIAMPITEDPQEALKVMTAYAKRLTALCQEMAKGARND